MTDVQELRRHVRVLEDQVEWDSEIGGQLATVKDRIDNLDQSHGSGD